MKLFTASCNHCAKIPTLLLYFIVVNNEYNCHVTSTNALLNIHGSAFIGTGFSTNKNTIEKTFQLFQNKNNIMKAQAMDVDVDVDIDIHSNSISTTSTSSSRRAWLTKSSSAAVATAASILSSTSNPELVNAAEIATSTTAITTVDNILCDPAVSIFEHPTKKRTVYLLGTAHISSKSADAAAQLVRDMKPKAVFVELDAKRVGRAIPKPSAESELSTVTPPTTEAASSASSSSPSVTTAVSNDNTATPTASPSLLPNNTIQPDQPTLKKPKFFDLREIALRKGSEVLGNSIKGLYSKLESEGFSAGEEFVVAVKEGLAINSKIILGDRDVEVTLRRLTEALSKTDLKKLLAADSELEENMKQLLPNDVKPNNLGDDEISKEQLRYFVETVKAKDNVKLLMNNLNSIAPEVYQALVAERDAFMANGLDGLDQFESIVAVMGIAHVDGVENNLKSRGWVEQKVKCPVL